jgi:hypothetical protein
MSDNDDAFAALLRKRAKKTSHHRKSHTTPPVSTKTKAVTLTSAAPAVPSHSRKIGMDPFSPLQVGQNPPKPTRSAVAIKPTRRGKRVRYLIHVDMVDAENRESIEDAAAAEGRSVSQWCRLVLLRAARGG